MQQFWTTSIIKNIIYKNFFAQSLDKGKITCKEKKNQARKSKKKKEFSSP
jgi:hypothetical protein